MTNFSKHSHDSNAATGNFSNIRGKRNNEVLVFLRTLSNYIVL